MDAAVIFSLVLLYHDFSSLLNFLRPHLESLIQSPCFAVKQLRAPLPCVWLDVNYGEELPNLTACLHILGFLLERFHDEVQRMGSMMGF